MASDHHGLERLETALADRYRIDREIGSGGMATVYLAEDLRHHRKVAVKVLDPDLAETLGAQRFLREIETAANLTHPHILPLYDSGEAEGLLFYVMPFVKGESLRARLTKERQLPIEDAVRITREIADALAYAHEQGVVHRDVKPANIMLEAGHAVLADFGVAHAVAEAKDERITRTGTSLGTPAYMSPEQASGEGDLDGRSDQYALGCVLYEMLAGHPPFAGAQVEAVVRQHLASEPPSVSLARPSVPCEVERVLIRALAKSPADRFRTTGEMAAELALGTLPAPLAGRPTSRLPRIGMAMAAVAVLGVAAMLISRSTGPESPGATVSGADHRPVIAVLPLDNFSPGPDQDFFAAGVQEDLTTKLQRIPTIAVISRTSVEQYRDQATRPPISRIADDLGADYLLEGSARIVGDSVRITVQLIAGATDTHLWAEDYDDLYSVENYVRLQSEIVQRIASDLRAVISPEDMAWLEAVPTRSLKAYEAYMKGNEAFFDERLTRLTSHAYESTRQYQEAVELDPRFALAHAALALDFTYSTDARERDRARESAGRALSLAREIPEARLALALLDAMQGDQEGADRQLDLAAAMAPEHSLVVRLMADKEWRQGAYDTAIEILSRAERLDPQDPILSDMLGNRYLFLHRYDEALEAFRREAARSGRRWGSPLGREVFIHLARGDREQARSAISQILGSDQPYWPPGLIATNYLAVVRRFMTAEERQLAFEAYTEWYRSRRDDFSCSVGEDFVGYCLNRALHETEVGSPEKARAAWDSLNVSLDPSRVPTYGMTYQYTNRALIYMMVGEKDAAVELAREAVNRFAREGCRKNSAQLYVCPTLARILAHVGEYDEAIDLLEEMLPAPSLFTVHLLEIDPIWDPLRSQPRFQALLQKYADDVEHRGGAVSEAARAH